MESNVELETLSFEDAYAQLESIVAQLESEDLAVDRAVELYETGMRLMRHCSSCLDGAELRIKQLVPAPDGDLQVVPLAFPG
jgi:exodeoxyribonuclease VII small subunit